MRNAGLIGLVLVVVVTAAVTGETKVLMLKDGRKFTGEVTKITTGWQVKTKLATLIFADEQVDRIVDVDKPGDEYEQLLAKIDPNNARAHFKLGRWAYDKGLLKIAKKELMRALEIDKNLEGAKLLLRRVNAEITPTTGRIISTTPANPNNGGSGQMPKEWLVSKEDIYRIRIAEIKVEKPGRLDTSAAVSFRGDVVERFITMMQGVSKKFDANSFRSMPSFNKLKRILIETDEASIRNDILLKKDPWVMRDFRAGICRIVIMKCGSLICHGAPKGQGQFKLLKEGARNERIDFSNFLILSQYTKGRRRMLNRDNVDDSLLLHYGLPDDDEKVKYKHPGKKKLKPAPFAKVTDPNYLRIQKWIWSLRGPGKGGGYYDVKYQAPYGPKPEAPLILDLDGKGPTTRPKGK